nr:zinc ribbon domain-containing protein [Candidatus Sigynarchaeum springense]
MVAQKQNVFTVFGTKLLIYSILVMALYFVNATIEDIEDIAVTPFAFAVSLFGLGFFVMGMVAGGSFVKQGKDLNERRMKAAGVLFAWYHLGSFIVFIEYILLISIYPPIETSPLNFILIVLINSLPVLGLIGWIMMLAYFLGHKDNKLVIPGIIGSIIVFSSFALQTIMNYVRPTLAHNPFAISMFPFSVFGYIACVACFFLLGSRGGLEAGVPAASKDAGWSRPLEREEARPSPFSASSIEPGDAPVADAATFPADSPSLASKVLPVGKSCDSCGELLPADAELQFCPNCGRKL